jgi:hypothetical protein
MGVVHRDPAGKRRLLKIMDRLRPAAIMLEVSPASVSWRKKRGPSWRRAFQRRIGALARETGLSKSRLMRGAALRGVWEYIRLPYEYRAAYEYGRREGVPVFVIDDSQAAESYLSRVESEILNTDNLRRLAEFGGDTDLASEVAREYQAAKARINADQPPQAAFKDREGWSRREADLSQKLRLLHHGLNRRAGQALTGRDLVHGLIISQEAVAYMPENVRLEEGGVHLYIGGWEHLIEDPGGLSFYSRLKDLDPQRLLAPVTDGEQ